MMSGIKRALSLLLTLIMLVSVCAISAFAEENDTMQYEYYTVLGDSIASAYGTPAYHARLADGVAIQDGYYTPGSYAAIVGEAVGAKCVDMRSHSGWRTYDLLAEIGCADRAAKDTIYAQYYKNEFFRRALNFLSAADLAGESERIISGIKNADLITLNIGTNDIYSYALAVTANKFSDIFEGSGILNIKGLDGLVSAFNELLRRANEQQMKGIVAEYVTATENGLAMYKKNLPVLIDAIREINKDADLVVVGMSNPTNFSLDVSKNISIDPYTISDLLMTRANMFTKNLCKQKDCLFVDVEGTKYNGLAVLDVDKLLALDEDVKYSAVKVVHPNEAGHKFMASQILTAMKSRTVVPAVAGRYSSIIKRNTLNWNPIDGATRYLVYRSVSPSCNYKYIGTSTKDIFYDYATVRGVTYYYKVCAVMNNSGSIRSPFSNPVALKAK